MAREVINFNSFFFRSKSLITRIGNQLSSPWKLNSPPPRPPKLQSLPSHLDPSSPPENQFSDQTLLFHLEEVVLMNKPFSVFSYFLLVAFEAGGLLRSIVLYLMYPFVRLAGEELGLKIMVFVAFFGLREKRFRVGRAVLPKFLLEDSASQGVEAVVRFEKKVCLTNLPRVMVEGFAVDFLGAEAVFGRELKVFCGFFVGLMDEGKRVERVDVVLKGLFGEEKSDEDDDSRQIVGLIGSRKSLDHHQRLLSRCKVVYQVSESEKRNWKALAREKYPKPLVFHDGRLAFKPSLISFMEMLLWLPFGLFLFATRLAVSVSLPRKISLPFLAFAGIVGTFHRANNRETPKTANKSRGTLYVCNHRTLIDPIILSMATGNSMAAVTYSLSRVSELLSPIRTVRLTRSRSRDSVTMDRLLRQRTDLVVCPEGTTCREPYLLRFSPMFAELADEIVPISIDVQFRMFYGTTAGGFKFMDPIFLLLNPRIECTLKVLEKVPTVLTSRVGGKSKFEVANYVQSKIGEALGFECTNFTRKDKYIILAGNEGRV